ncbi:hypothetical protein STIAU_1392 [Stigmatella aurantiaca DW4/3-1]|uniref:Uncharacterized protein n=1 Tax=Stigmatella aurantiaca (strain DW4/3-1) TaxID=378806 RepID=Q08VZ8_STIAD|nr:hypothetical protein STIAU_1392 [Stigmatella aurantiaca DW4/3-1]
MVLKRATRAVTSSQRQAKASLVCQRCSKSSRGELLKWPSTEVTSTQSARKGPWPHVSTACPSKWCGTSCAGGSSKRKPSLSQPRAKDSKPSRWPEKKARATETSERAARHTYQRSKSSHASSGTPKPARASRRVTAVSVQCAASPGRAPASSKLGLRRAMSEEPPGVPVLESDAAQHWQLPHRQLHIRGQAVQRQVHSRVAQLPHSGHVANDVEHVRPGHLSGREALGVLEVESEVDARVGRAVRLADAEVGSQRLADARGDILGRSALAQEEARGDVHAPIHRLLDAHLEGEGAGEDFRYLPQHLGLERGRGRPAALGHHVEDAGILRNGGVLVGRQHEGAGHTGQTPGVDFEVFAGDGACQGPEALRGQQLRGGDRLPIRATRGRSGVVDGHLHRVAVGVLKAALHDDEAPRVHVADRAAPRLVHHHHGASGRQAVGAGAEADGGLVPLVDADEEVGVAGAGVEEGVHLTEGALGGGHAGGAVDVGGEVQVRFEVGEAAGVEELGVRLRVLGHSEDAGRVCAGRNGGGGQQLEADGLRHFLSADNGAGGERDGGCWRQGQAQLHLGGGCLGTVKPVAQHACQGDDVAALSGGGEARFAGEVVLVAAKDVANEGVHLQQDVAEAGDFEIAPVGEDALHERDEARAQGVEVAVGVVGGRREKWHVGTRRQSLAAGHLAETGTSVWCPPRGMVGERRGEAPIAQGD